MQKENEEKFVELKNNNLWIIDMQYPKLNLKNSINKCFIRVSLLNMLTKAANELPVGYKFKIWDAWRPFKLQEELYYKYKDLIIKEFHLMDYSKEEQESIIKQYVSLPKKDPLFPPMHTTGGAIDLTIIDKNNNELNMGSEFDEFTKRSNTSYYNNTNKKINNNRKLLLNVMHKASFVNLSSEWWHFDYGDHFWANKTNKQALYSGVYDEFNLSIL